MGDKPAVPMRIQLSRRKGWRMPPGTAKVDRTTKWGNPFVKHGDGYLMDKANAVACFRSMVEKEGAWSPIPLPWPKGKIPAQWTTIEEVRAELRGRNLACWCRLCPAHAAGRPADVVCADCDPCHVDVLLEIANAVQVAPHNERGGN